LNKQELISMVSSKTKFSKALCSNVISATFNVMGTALKKGEKVQMVNFGTWKKLRRKARLGRNPKTGKPLNIPAKNVVKFSAGTELLDSIN
jgi:DNA-binding protein HU-beta